MKSPIFCFDLDGTLLNEQGRIHPRDVALLAGCTPELFIPTTGRPLHAVQRMLARHGLFCNRPIPFPLLLQNGSLLYLPGEQPLEYTPIPPKEQAVLLRLAETTPEVTFLLLDQRSIHMLWPNPFAVQAVGSYDFIIQPFTTESRNHAFSKLMAISENPECLAYLEEEIAGMNVETAYSMATVLEVTPAGVNKGWGLRRLLAALGAEDSPIYAAGDGGNDLALFEKAQMSFAPRSSPPLIRAAATHVIEVEENGILAPMLLAAGVSLS